MEGFMKGNFVQKRIVIVLTMLAIVSLFGMFNGRATTVHADNIPEYTYNSIEVMKDDSVWSIADKYCPKNMDKNEYISMIEEVNGISSNHIVEGKYILVPIYE